MGKAFSEEEKVVIKTKLLEEALKLFHDSGTKALSIRELTKRAGISQGSFYSFWKDKDALVMELMKYRANQKLESIQEHFPESLENPAGFLIQVLYIYSMDLKEKIDTKPIYAESFQLFFSKNPIVSNKMEDIYSDFFHSLTGYWISHHVVQKVDVKGLINCFTGCVILFANAQKFDHEYFEVIFRTYLESTVHQFIETGEGR